MKAACIGGKPCHMCQHPKTMPVKAGKSGVAVGKGGGQGEGVMGRRRTVIRAGDEWIGHRRVKISSGGMCHPPSVAYSTTVARIPAAEIAPPKKQDNPPHLGGIRLSMNY